MVFNQRRKGALSCICVSFIAVSAIVTGSSSSFLLARNCSSEISPYQRIDSFESQSASNGNIYRDYSCNYDDSGSYSTSYNNLIGFDSSTASCTTPEFSPSSVSPDAFPVSTSISSYQATDNRSVVNQSTHFRTICTINTHTQYSNGQVEDGSGAIISSQCIITAAHCLVKENTFEVGNCTVFTRLLGDTYYTMHKPTDIVIPAAYFETNNGDPNYDWAILRFNGSFGTQFGYYSIKSFANLAHSNIGAVGYSGDDTKLYISRSNGINNTTDYVYSGFGKVTAGMSGGPLFEFDGDNVCVVGVITKSVTKYNIFGFLKGYGYMAIKVRYNHLQVIDILENYY